MKLIRVVDRRVWNVIYTEGILKGLSVKQLSILFYIVHLHKIRRISIPLWIMGYNRKYADYIFRMSERAREEWAKDDNEKK